MNTDMKDQVILKNNDIVVRKMKAEGRTSQEIAERLGVHSVYSVRTYCSKNNIKLPDGMKNSVDVCDVAEKIRKATNDAVEYVSGYETKESTILVRCLKCGGVFEKTFHNITTHHTAVCPHCAEYDRVSKQMAWIDKRNEKEREKAKRKAEREEHKRLSHPIPHLCPVCGAITTNPRFCSKACSTKAHSTTHEHTRRMRMQKDPVDNDITVLGLFLRDSGVCQLCGGRCDSEDYEMKDGVFIAGNKYPSIDHIIPLSKGGEHSWDNVQLAHRICNTKKRDQVYGEGIRTSIL